MAKLSDKELAANYGWALATLNSNPELKKLFQLSVKKQYTPQRFVAELRNTKWFQANSESARKYMVLKTADPAEYKSQIAQLGAHAQDIYSKATGMALSPDLASAMADMALKAGWSDEQLADHVASSVDWHKLLTENSLGGSAAQTMQQMRAQALNQGVRLSDSWVEQGLENIIAGNDTVDGLNQKINDMAVSRYPGFAEQLNGGQTMAQITEGYKQSASQVLEIDPGQIDMFDKNIQKAVSNTNDQGQPAPLNLNQFEDMLRQDDRWQYTKNAKESLMTTGANVLRSFGLAN